MWCSDRRQFLIGVAAALAGATGLAACSFSPVYAPGGPGRALQNRVVADLPVSRADYQFIAALEDRLGRPTDPRFSLSYRITQQELASVDAARARVMGRLDYELTSLATGQIVASGRVDSATGYSSTDTQLAELAAAEDAETRLTRMLADGLIARLMTNAALGAE